MKVMIGDGEKENDRERKRERSSLEKAQVKKNELVF